MESRGALLSTSLQKPAPRGHAGWFGASGLTMRRAARQPEPAASRLTFPRSFPYPDEEEGPPGSVVIAGSTIAAPPVGHPNLSHNYETSRPSVREHHSCVTRFESRRQHRFLHRDSRLWPGLGRRGGEPDLFGVPRRMLHHAFAGIRGIITPVGLDWPRRRVDLSGMEGGWRHRQTGTKELDLGLRNEIRGSRREHSLGGHGAPSGRALRERCQRLPTGGGITACRLWCENLKFFNRRCLAVC